MAIEAREGAIHRGGAGAALRRQQRRWRRSANEFGWGCHGLDMIAVHADTEDPNTYGGEGGGKSGKDESPSRYSGDAKAGYLIFVHAGEDSGPGRSSSGTPGTGPGAVFETGTGWRRRGSGACLCDGGAYGAN